MSGLSQREMNMVLERWDQTSPDLQREIVAKLVSLVSEYSAGCDRVVLAAAAVLSNWWEFGPDASLDEFMTSLEGAIREYNPDMLPPPYRGTLDPHAQC